MRCTISLINFGTESYMFWTGLLSTIRSPVLRAQQQVLVIQVMLTVCQ